MEYQRGRGNLLLRFFGAPDSGERYADKKGLEPSGTAMKHLSSWYHGARRHTRALLVAIALLLLIVGCYGGIRELALRSADHVTVTVTRSNDSPDGPHGSLVYQHTFGRPLAAEAQYLLNNETSPPSYLSYLTGLGGSALFGGLQWDYRLTFTWHGIVIETADMLAMESPERFSISALGLSDLRPHITKNNLAGGSIIAQLAKDSGDVIPLSWGPPAS